MYIIKHVPIWLGFCSGYQNLVRICKPLKTTPIATVLMVILVMHIVCWKKYIFSPTHLSCYLLQCRFVFQQSNLMAVANLFWHSNAQKVKLLNSLVSAIVLWIGRYKLSLNWSIRNLKKIGNVLQQLYKNTNQQYNIMCLNYFSGVSVDTDSNKAKISKNLKHKYV
jgi:hypothetical protein